MIAGGLHLMEITMKYVSVSETKMTSIGLMRPGIPYALDETFQPHALVLGLIKTKKLDAKILNDDDAAALLHVGLAHYPDDMGAPLAAQTIVASLATKAAAKAAADAKAVEDAAKVAADAKAAEDAAKAAADAKAAEVAAKVAADAKAAEDAAKAAEEKPASGKSSK